MTAPRRAERDPAAAAVEAAAGAAGRPRAARAAWSPGSGARGPGPAAVPASRYTFSPGGGATCGSVRPNMATRSSRRESRLPFLFTLVALLPPGALGAVWTQTLHGGRAPLPQDRGFRVVQGEPREPALWARGEPRGADEKPLRRRRSAALQPEPIKVYGQVSGRPPAFPQLVPLPALPQPRIHPLRSSPRFRHHWGLPGLRFFLNPPSHECARPHLNGIDLSSFLSILANAFQVTRGVQYPFPQGVRTPV